MPHRILQIDSAIGDLAFVVFLQIMNLDVDNSVKLQISGLLGSMLAVRTMDGKVGLTDCIKVAFSGMILANFIGFFWCDYRGILLDSIRAYSVFFVLGFFSDIILRGVRSFGNSFVSHVPDLTKTLLQKVKAVILKQ